MLPGTTKIIDINHQPTSFILLHHHLKKKTNNNNNFILLLPSK